MYRPEALRTPRRRSRVLVQSVRIACIGMGLSAGIPALAAPFDFQSDTVGAFPSAGLVGVIASGSTPSGTAGVKIADSTTTPADPFGVPGNKSLQMMKMLGGGADARVRFGYGGSFPTSLTNGTMELDLYMSLNVPAGYTNPGLAVSLGSGGGQAQNFTTVGPIIEMRGHARDIRVYESGGSRTLDQEIFPNVVNHLVIDWDAASMTFTLKLNGTTLTDNGGAVSSFQFYGSPSGIDSALLYNSTGSDNLTFVDNVNLPVPTLDGWAVDGSGDWNVSPNWNGVLPNAVNAIANFRGTGSAPRTVFTNTAVTVGTVMFDSSNPYQLTGQGSLTLQVNSGLASVNVVTGNHEINLDLNVLSNTNISVAPASTLTIGDPLALAGAVSLTKLGTGTMVIDSTMNSVPGGTLKLNAGVTHIHAASNDADLSLDLGGGTVNLGANQTLGGVVLRQGGNTLRVGRDSAGDDVPANLNAAAMQITGSGANNTLVQTLATNTVRVAGALQIDAASKLVKQGSGVLVVGSLAINSTGQLDLTTGRMIVDYGGATPIAALRQDLQANRLTSSSSDASRRLGYAESSVLGAGSFGGVTLTDATNLLITLTLAGDANLDLTVDSLDFNALAGGYGIVSGQAVWTQGDFDYDGKVTTLDFNLLAGNFNQSMPPAGALLGAAVPEPSGLLALALTALIAQRSRFNAKPQ